VQRDADGPHWVACSKLLDGSDVNVRNRGLRAVARRSKPKGRKQRAKRAAILPSGVGSVQVSAANVVGGAALAEKLKRKSLVCDVLVGAPRQLADRTCRLDLLAFSADASLTSTCGMLTAAIGRPCNGRPPRRVRGREGFAAAVGGREVVARLPTMRNMRNTVAKRERGRRMKGGPKSQRESVRRRLSFSPPARRPTTPKRSAAPRSETASMNMRVDTRATALPCRCRDDHSAFVAIELGIRRLSLVPHERLRTRVTPSRNSFVSLKSTGIAAESFCLVRWSSRRRVL